MSPRALPPETPLEMPRAPLHGARRKSLASRTRAQIRRTWWARAYLITVVLALSIYGSYTMYQVVSSAQPVALQWLFLVLFTISFAWISLAFAQASLGFLRLLAPQKAGPPGADRAGSGRAALPRTAVVMPVYNEDPQRIGATLGSLAAGLADAAPGRFAVFALSDTNRPAAWIAEEQVFLDLHRNAPTGCPCYYRRRVDNAERKAGNIADWVQRFGGAFEAMVVLDADSIMAPETIVALARRLGADDGIGLIQTLPMLVRGNTLFGRLQQFASHCYGVVNARGLSAWSGLSGNFWGHNAIIRVSAFAAACRLPRLSGRPPFGGHILSHDFVEAALMRRAGWGVLFHTDLEGSYEESPGSLMDGAVRDRRWCQGNLQHAGVLGARGLRTSSRLHMLTGIMAYLSAPIWLALVSVGLTLSVQAHLVEYQYFSGPSLFPRWPAFEAEQALALLGVSMVVLLGPKLLGWLRLMRSSSAAAGFGGRAKLTGSVLLEIVCSALYAPVIMVSHCLIVMRILCGDDCGWPVQREQGGRIPWHQHWRRYWPHCAIGAFAAGLALYMSTHLFLWLLPFTLGLLLAPVVSRCSDSSAIAAVLARWGMLQTPPETSRPAAVRDMELALTQAPRRTPRNPLRALTEDPVLCRWHIAQLGETPGRFDEDQVLAAAKVEHSGRDLDRLAGWLSPPQMLALLGDAASLRRLSSTLQIAPQAGESRTG